MYDDSALYHCAYCGEPNGIDVDPFAARTQTYVEDCQVCCRPNLLRLTVDEDLGVTVTAEPDN